MDSGREAFPSDIEALKAALVTARDERIAEAAKAAQAEAELAVARAKASHDQALIAHQQLRIEKLTRQLYGPRSERTSRLLDQIELQFEELESSATEDEIAAEIERTTARMLRVLCWSSAIITSLTCSARLRSVISSAAP